MDNINLNYAHLQEMMEDFYHLTKIRISFWSITGEKLFMAPQSGNSDFCQELRSIKEIDYECHQCDLRAFRNAHQSESRLYRYQCAAGLNEYVYPVIYQNTLLGYFMYGQVRNENVDLEGRYHREKLYHTYKLDAKHMTHLYKHLPYADEQALLAAGRMMASIASFAYLNGFITDHSIPLAIRVQRYIQVHFMNPITLDSICSVFNVSRSSMCHTIQTELGSTFLKLLNQARIENVCRCLENGQSISDASMQSGYQSPNYMARIFKSYMNCSPSEYRSRYASPQDDCESKSTKTPPAQK